MILIHTALQCEAQCIIEKYKLKKTNSTPKIYSDDTFIVVIGGVGKDNTFQSLEYVFTDYSITKAVNLGIAGCSDLNTSIGALFSCFNTIPDINFKELRTVDTPQVINQDTNFLYDMEGKYFLQISQRFLDDKNINIIKIVSDHLHDILLDKDTIKNLICKNIDSIYPILQ